MPYFLSQHFKQASVPQQATLEQGMLSPNVSPFSAALHNL